MFTFMFDSDIDNIDISILALLAVIIDKPTSTSIISEVYL